MNKERVVITGVGAVSPFGVGADRLWDSLSRGECGIAAMPGRETVVGLEAGVAGLVPDVNPKAVPRVYRRSMSRMGIYAYKAALEALAETGGHPQDMGLAIGGTMGSPDTMVDFFTEYFGHGGLGTVRSTTFFKFMGHGVASSLALALGLTGRVVAPSAACAAGIVAVGAGYESIASGRQAMALCGGAEEFNVLTAATFDHIQAASHNLDPAAASRPFDARRDGVVCGEGAGLLLLENYERAKSRNADIWAEVVGYASNSSPKNLVYPDVRAIRECMEQCLDDAGVTPGEVSLVSAHATSTVEGDRAEARALAEYFGPSVPVCSLKGQLGHAMAASGSLELIACLRMMREGVILPNHNLDDIDPECGGINLPREKIAGPVDMVLKNSFALGGINASLLVRKA